jgi:hypothetical protein
MHVCARVCECLRVRASVWGTERQQQRPNRYTTCHWLLAAPIVQELFDKALMNIVLPYLKAPDVRSAAAAYTTKGIEVLIAPEVAAVAGTSGPGNPAATSWGFAASGLAAANGVEGDASGSK